MGIRAAVTGKFHERAVEVENELTEDELNELLNRFFSFSLTSSISH